MSKKAFDNLCCNAVNDYSYKKLKKQLAKYNPIMLAWDARFMCSQEKWASKL